jgi:hypothetical protein
MLNCDAILCNTDAIGGRFARDNNTSLGRFSVGINDAILFGSRLYIQGTVCKRANIGGIMRCFTLSFPHQPKVRDPLDQSNEKRRVYTYM